MNKTLNVKSIRNGAFKQSLPVIFEGQVKDGDDFRFVIASTESASFKADIRKSSGLLIGRGDDDFFNPDHAAVSPVFPVLPYDDKKIIAQQLRELADWFDSQA